jgi:hypothetical protein
MQHVQMNEAPFNLRTIKIFCFDLHRSPTETFEMDFVVQSVYISKVSSVRTQKGPQSLSAFHNRLEIFRSEELRDKLNWIATMEQ